MLKQIRDLNVTYYNDLYEDDYRLMIIELFRNNKCVMRNSCYISFSQSNISIRSFLETEGCYQILTQMLTDRQNSKVRIRMQPQYSIINN